MILPPKRYEDPGSPIYDPIRHKPWFKKLEKRREKIPFLNSALAEYGTGPISFQTAAQKYKVHERELRGYRNFVSGYVGFPSCSKTLYQSIIDDAYERFKECKASRSFYNCINKSAKLYGQSPRRITEAWDCDRNFYPTNYMRSSA